MVLRRFDVAESENDTGFSKSAVVFEISVFFIFGKRKIVNFCICQIRTQVSIAWVLEMSLR